MVAATSRCRRCGSRLVGPPRSARDPLAPDRPRLTGELARQAPAANTWRRPASSARRRPPCSITANRRGKDKGIAAFVDLVEERSPSVTCESRPSSNDRLNTAAVEPSGRRPQALSGTSPGSQAEARHDPTGPLSSRPGSPRAETTQAGRRARDSWRMRAATVHRLEQYAEELEAARGRTIEEGLGSGSPVMSCREHAVRRHPLTAARPSAGWSPARCCSDRARTARWPWRSCSRRSLGGARRPPSPRDLRSRGVRG